MFYSYTIERADSSHRINSSLKTKLVSRSVRHKSSRVSSTSRIGVHCFKEAGKMVLWYFQEMIYTANHLIFGDKRGELIYPYSIEVVP